MTLEGHIQNGQIILHHNAPLPEGVKVRIEFLDSNTSESNTSEEASDELPSLYERVKPFIGSVKGLPEDFAKNHDHYLHGQPKRQ